MLDAAQSEYPDLCERDIFKCWLSEVAQERKSDEEYAQ